jgi:integrase/recombinase XerD
MEQELNKFAYYLVQRRFSDRTIRAYHHALKSLFKYFDGKHPYFITEFDIKDYLTYLVEIKNVSDSAQKIVINSAKLYFKIVQGKELGDIILVNPKGSWKLPTFLSKEEIKSVINNTNNLKHKSIISITYACGLRISETINLKLNDIDSKNMIVWVREGKGRKDRIIPMPQNVLQLLREYWKQYKPKEWLFEGPEGGQYSRGSIQKVFKNACKASKINRDATFHSLRHSFATHLIEQGTNLRYVQQLLGHRSIKTTEIYTHVTDVRLTQINNPIEDIDLN